jgi:rhodanese-related sulfurtransferase
MPLQLRKGVKQMVSEALTEIETLSVEQAQALLGRPDVTFIDLRDPRELWRDGGVPGAINVTRGMLEFWIDPGSPYHKDFFASGNKFVFFCGGGWRSALAAKTAQDMGLTPVCHIDGGFGAWKKAGAPVDAIEPTPGGATKA